MTREWYNTNMTRNPEGWPEGWPDIPTEWNPRPGNLPHRVAVSAVAEVRFPDPTDGPTYQYPVLAIDAPTADTPGSWAWWDEDRDHLVAGPPTLVDDPFVDYRWTWTDPENGIKVSVRPRRPTDPEPNPQD